MRHVDPKSHVDDEVIEEVQHNIEICNDAPAIISRQADSAGYVLDNTMQKVYVKSLGDAINSPYPEYAQVVMNHDSTIIFTSRRPASQNGKKDFMTDQYFEDIFISHKDSMDTGKLLPYSQASCILRADQDNLASVYYNI